MIGNLKIREIVAVWSLHKDDNAEVAHRELKQWSQFHNEHRFSHVGRESRMY